MSVADLVLAAIMLLGPLIPIFCVVMLITGFVLAIFLGLTALLLSRV